MISFELAKKLKDAGFPMAMTDHETCPYQQAEQFEIGGMFYHVPTLSELIEACGDWGKKQFSLYGRSKDRWEATSVYISMKTLDNESITKYDLTPEGAVANLWLELNEK